MSCASPVQTPVLRNQGCSRGRLKVAANPLVLLILRTEAGALPPPSLPLLQSHWPLEHTWSTSFTHPTIGNPSVAIRPATAPSPPPDPSSSCPNGPVPLPLTSMACTALSTMRISSSSHLRVRPRGRTGAGAGTRPGGEGSADVMEDNPSNRLGACTRTADPGPLGCLPLLRVLCICCWNSAMATVGARVSGGEATGERKDGNTRETCLRSFCEEVVGRRRSPEGRGRGGGDSRYDPNLRSTLGGGWRARQRMH